MLRRIVLAAALSVLLAAPAFADTLFFNDAVSGTVVNVASSGNALTYLRVVNTTGSTAYLQIFNVASASVTLGTTSPTATIRLNANEAAVVSPNRGIPLLGSGISMAGTTTATGTDSAAISVMAQWE